MRDHVGYESWLERDRLILLDGDPQVRAISSQPFWLHWHDGRRQRRHAPDYFVRLAAGQAQVVDVRAEKDMDQRTREAFAATERACAAAGWQFEWVGRPDPVLMANVRWLARCRRARSGRPVAVAERLLEVFGEPKGLWEGAELGPVRATSPGVFACLPEDGYAARQAAQEPLPTRRATARPHTPGICAACRRPVSEESVKDGRLTCSHGCRQKAYRQRKAMPPE